MPLDACRSAGFFQSRAAAPGFFFHGTRQMSDENRASPMKRLSAEVVLMWGSGDDYLFALKGKQIEQLEITHGRGIALLAREIIQHQCSYSLIRDVILLGLEGGGMHPVEAEKLMRRYFEGVPLAAANDPTAPLNMAIAIMSAAWFGVDMIKQPYSAGIGGSSEGGGEIDMARVREILAAAGVNPDYAERHSLYEIISMMTARDRKGELSDEDFDAMLKKLEEKKEREGLN